MALAFSKMHGCGNDFVVISDPGREREWGKIAPALLDRHFGIGGDGLMVIRPPRPDGTVPVDMFNPDGSAMGMCGNGIRCVARWLMDRDATEASGLSFDVGGRAISCRAAPAGWVEVETGKPSFHPNEIPLSVSWADKGEPMIEASLQAAGRAFKASAVSMGNPHCVIMVDDLAEIDLNLFGPALERHSAFPQRANVSFARLSSPDTLELKVWERGAGATLACGTAACASAAVAARLGTVSSQVKVDLPGGGLSISIGERGVSMAGPAELIYDGQLDADWLSRLWGETS